LLSCVFANALDESGRMQGRQQDAIQFLEWMLTQGERAHAAPSTKRRYEAVAAAPMGDGTAGETLLLVMPQSPHEQLLMPV
jgi:hypothetical protein